MVSVIIPVYNAEKYVEHAIESVLSQPEVSNIYLVDDASTDRSLEVINRIAAGSDRVTFITHSRMNIGAGATRNLAIGLVDTPYISFLDADDYYRLDRFTDSVRLLEADSNIDGVYGIANLCFETPADRIHYSKIIGSGKSTMDIQPPDDSSRLYRSLLDDTSGWFHLSTLLLRTNFLKKVGLFDPDLRQGEDTDMILRLALAGNLAPTNGTKPLVVRNISSGNTILNREQNRFYKNHFSRKWFFLSIQKRLSLKYILYFLRSYLATHKNTCSSDTKYPIRLLRKTKLAFQLILDGVVR